MFLAPKSIWCQWFFSVWEKDQKILVSSSKLDLHQTVANFIFSPLSSLVGWLVGVAHLVESSHTNRLLFL
jgi:hypothetical protein